MDDRKIDYDTLFEPQFNYTPPEIAAKTGLPLELIRAAAQRREISNVCTISRDGLNKCYKGHKVIAWLKFRASQTPAQAIHQGSADNAERGESSFKPTSRQES